MKKCVNGKMVDFELTPEEIAAMEAERRRYELMEKSRPLSEYEVSRMLITQQINTLAVDDQTALRMMEYYPAWVTNTAYSAGYKVQYNGKLYKVITAHTSQADWAPDVAVTLFERIDEEHDGSEYDPIPYDGNMALESGKHYTQDGVVYKCTRDTGDPVYHALADLVGLYAEEVYRL
jgi:hypothetical protein